MPPKDKPLLKLPTQPPSVTNARTRLRGALGTVTTGIGPNHMLALRRDVNLVLEWLDGLDVLGGV